jgi:hypothetical protein
MSARRTDMHRLQEVVRLHRMGRSSRRIARQLQSNRSANDTPRVCVRLPVSWRG